MTLIKERKFTLVSELVDSGEFPEAKLSLIDGLRAEFSYGWGLVRASNTAAEITMRFEAETEEQVHQLKALFTRELRKIEPSLALKW